MHVVSTTCAERIEVDLHAGTGLLLDAKIRERMTTKKKGTRNETVETTCTTAPHAPFQHCRTLAWCFPNGVLFFFLASCELAEPCRCVPSLAHVCHVAFRWTEITATAKGVEKKSRVFERGPSYHDECPLLLREPSLTCGAIHGAQRRASHRKPPRREKKKPPARKTRSDTQLTSVHALAVSATAQKRPKSRTISLFAF